MEKQDPTAKEAYLRRKELAQMRKLFKHVNRQQQHRRTGSEASRNESGRSVEVQ